MTSAVSGGIVCLQIFTTDKVKNLQTSMIFLKFFWRKEDNTSRKITTAQAILQALLHIKGKYF